MDFRNVDGGDHLLYSDRFSGETRVEVVEFVGLTEDGHPSVRFADGSRRMVLAKQLSPLPLMKKSGRTVTFTGVRWMITKVVKAQGTAGRVYLPVEEVGHKAIIIFLDED